MEFLIRNDIFDCSNHQVMLASPIIFRQRAVDSTQQPVELLMGYLKNLVCANKLEGGITIFLYSAKQITFEQNQSNASTHFKVSKE